MSTTTSTNTLQIQPIPAFDDNYIWCFHDGSRAVVVDPGDSAPVQAFLQGNKLELDCIIITHHHPDHIGGLPTLTDNRNLTVYGPNNPGIALLTDHLTEGDSVTLLGCEFKVFTTPGHTLDHIVYFSDDVGGQPVVFCGDTLFAGGCGRLFEGDPAMMLKSLDKLAALPSNTQVFCAHEYTMANLRFAEAVEPDNSTLQQRISNCQALRDQQTPTVPSLLADELATNPFMRAREAAVAKAAQQRDASTDNPAEVFAAIRSWKDNF